MKGDADRGEGTLLGLVQVFLLPFRSLPPLASLPPPMVYISPVVIRSGKYNYQVRNCE